MNDYASGSLIAQVRPGDTNNATAITATVRLEIGRIIIANTSSGAATFRLFHDVGGTTYDEANAIAWDVSIAVGAINDALQSFNTGNGITLMPTDSLGVRVSTGNALTFNIYGVLADAR
tara:strand:- start:2831 stop:3187 length:357 start_codon:yes stop_codon:yes gene_type:complete